MNFTTLLKIEPTGKTRWGRPEYRLREPLVYEITCGRRLIVPQNFLTDLASTPWGFRWLLAKWPQPAVLHDYLCGIEGFSRFLADAFFRDAMRAVGVPLWRRVIAYYYVRFYAVLTRKR